MNTRLEVVRVNKDVIATSCSNQFAIFHSTGSAIDGVLASPEQVANDQEKYNAVYNFCINRHTMEKPPEGTYHINIDGTIGSKCDNPDDNHVGFVVPFG